MKMTPAMVIIGGFIIFWAAMVIVVILPTLTLNEKPSAAFRPMTAAETAGHRLYVQNGCSYCHSQFIRVNDWGHGAERIAESGDYFGHQPLIYGTERIGPDLSQEGGERPDDWHLAHFTNPRTTSPISLMPNWEFLGRKDITSLIAYMQYEGGKDADTRMARQRRWKAEALAAHRLGMDGNIKWIHDHVPEPWRMMPNPYPASDAALARGHYIYQQFCIGCHGTMGDGNGPAAQFLAPRPLNFTQVRKHLQGNRYIGGIFYYQIMNGITGTGMPYFKKDLESEKIWDVGNYIAVSFVGYTDANIEPRGIDASYEPDWKNDFRPPELGGK